MLGGGPTYFDVLPLELKYLLKAYYHSASEEWIRQHRDSERVARGKADEARRGCSTRLYRYNRGVPELVLPSEPRPLDYYMWIDSSSSSSPMKHPEPTGSNGNGEMRVLGSDGGIWVDSPPYMPSKCYCGKWSCLANVPWTEHTKETYEQGLRERKAAQYEFVAAKLALKAAELEYQYPVLYEWVCILLLGVSTARGHIDV